jgi:hypothetical protein
MTSRRTGEPPRPRRVPFPHRPRCTGKPLGAHTPVHVIGMERVDADTDTENDRHAYQPQGRPPGPRTPNPHRSLSNRASSTWLPAHKVRGGPARGLMRSPKSHAVMQRRVGGHHSTAAAPPGLMTPEGRPLNRWGQAAMNINKS